MAKPVKYKRFIVFLFYFEYEISFNLNGLIILNNCVSDYYLLGLLDDDLLPLELLPEDLELLLELLPEDLEPLL